MTNNLLYITGYLAGALFAWRWLHTRYLDKQSKVLLWIAIIWGIAGAAATLTHG